MIKWVVLRHFHQEIMADHTYAKADNTSDAPTPMDTSEDSAASIVISGDKQAGSPSIVRQGVNNSTENEAIDITDNKNNLNNSDTECNITCKGTLNNTLKTFNFYPSTKSEKDLWVFLHENKSSIEKILNKELNDRRGLKYYGCVKVILKKNEITLDGVLEKFDNVYRQSKCRTLLPSVDLGEDLELLFEDILEKILLYQGKGSGWVIEKIIKLDVSVGTYTPLKGSSYIPLPHVINVKKACINIQNKDQKCFIWCVLASLHHVTRNAYRVSHYKKYEGELNMKGLTFPLTLNQIAKFEKQNNIGVNVFGCEGKVIFPLHITNNRLTGKHVNLLLLVEGEKSHYVLVKNFNALLYDQNCHKAKTYFCYYCLHGFSSAE